MNKKYYITTPIYYPSGTWHIGTCYTTVVCDALARFKRMDGFDVFYLTGTDEHGQKIERKALTLGEDTKKYVDKQVATLKALWETLGITYDKFIRTTDKEHIKAIQNIFTKLYEKGDIYKSQYEGWYCTPCESFWTKTQLDDGKCPDCGRDVEMTKEESYFFRLSKYQERLTDLIENNEEFLQPKSRRNEMLNNFLKPGLQDLAVSRTSFKWGVPVPCDSDHVVYVWLDALCNYITALGYGSEDTTLFEKYWPADVQMMGKEIVRFHSIIWPAILMALDIPLPKKVYGHGWLMLGASKMAKSSGNIVDPTVLSNRYGVDALRYYLLREVPFGSDGAYTNAAFLGRINTDLCNNLGNLLSRTTAMINQYFGGVLPVRTDAANPFDKDLEAVMSNLESSLRDNIDELLVPEALTGIFALGDRANKYIDETTPWILAKDESKRASLANVLYHLAEALRIMGIALAPFLPDTSKRILSDLSVERADFSDLKFGVLKGGEKITKSEAIFKRIDVNKELIEMQKISDAAESAKTAKNAENTEKPSAKAEEKNMENVEKFEEITIDDFAKIQLKTGKILTAEKVEKSKKLLHFTVDTGEKIRSIVSGVAKWYTPEEMVGKSVVVVANLRPATIGGILSEGMILFGEDESGVVCVEPSKPLKNGAEVR